LGVAAASGFTCTTSGRQAFSARRNLPSNLARQRRLAAERDDVADIRSSGVLATAPGGHPSQIMFADPSLAERLGDAVGPFETVARASQAQSFVDARLRVSTT
jgi:hypothetical protein